MVVLHINKPWRYANITQDKHTIKYASSGATQRGTALYSSSSATVCVQMPFTTSSPAVYTPAGRWNTCSGFAMRLILVPIVTLEC